MSVDFVNRMRKSFRKPSVYTILHRRAMYLYNWTNQNDEDMFEENMSFARKYHYGHSNWTETVGPKLEIPCEWYYLLCCCMYFDAENLLDSLAECKMTEEELECYLTWLSTIESDSHSTFDDLCTECAYALLQDL